MHVLGSGGAGSCKTGENLKGFIIASGNASIPFDPYKADVPEKKQTKG